MARKLVHDYTFTPASRQVVLNYIYKPERLLMIVNATDNITIYQFNSPTLNYTSINYNYTAETTTIILAYDTTSMSNTDKLQVWVDEDSISFQPDETFLDPVSKIRVSNPENLIDTDFEYGLQSQKWETLEQVKNIPTFFSRSGDVGYGISAVNVLINSDIVTVELTESHNLAKGSPVIVVGSKSITCDGGFVATNILSSTSFQYKAKSQQTFSGSILDQYTQIFPGSVYQGTEFDLSGIEAITTDGAAASTLTVNTTFPTNFSQGTSFYLTNSIASISQNFDPDLIITRGYEDVIVATANTNSFTTNEFALKSVQPYYHTGMNTDYFQNSVVGINLTDNVLEFGSDIGFEDGWYTYIVGVGNTAISGLTDKTVYYVEQAEGVDVYDDFESGGFDAAKWASSTNVIVTTQGTGTGSDNNFGPNGTSTRYAIFYSNFNQRQLVTQQINMTDYVSVSFDHIVGNGTNGGSSPNSTELLVVEIFHPSLGFTTLLNRTASPTTWTTLTYTIPVNYRISDCRLYITQTNADGTGSDELGLDNIRFLRNNETRVKFRQLDGTEVTLGSVGSDGGVTRSALIKTERCFDTVGGELLFTADDSTVSRNINIPVGTPVAFLNSSAGFGLTSMPNLQTSVSGIYYVVGTAANRISIATTPGGGVISVPDGQETYVVPLTALSDANTIIFPGHGLTNNSLADFQTLNGGSAPASNSTFVIERFNDDKIRLKNTTSGTTVNLTSAGVATSVFQLNTKIDNLDVDSIYLQSNNLNDGQEVTYDDGGNSPISGLVDGGTYYVFQKSVDRIKLAETEAGWSSEPVSFVQSYPNNSGVSSGMQFYMPSHGFGSGDRVQYLSINPMIGLANGAWYYVNAVSADRVRLYREKASAQAGTSDYVKVAGPATGTGTLRRADLVDMAIGDSTVGINLGSYSLEPLEVVSGSGSLSRDGFGLSFSNTSMSIFATSTTTDTTSSYLSDTLQTLGDDWLAYTGVASGQARFKTMLKDSTNIYIIGTHRERTGSRYDWSVIAYDLNGARQWIRTGYSSTYDFTVTGADFQDANNLIICGSFETGSQTYPAIVPFSLSTRTFGNTAYTTSWTPGIFTGIAWRQGSGYGYVQMRYNNNQTLMARINNSLGYFWIYVCTSGNTLTDGSKGTKITTDSSNNVYFMQYTSSDGYGNFSMQVYKYNINFSRLWVSTIGGINEDRPYGIDLDSSNNVYISGYTYSQGQGNGDMFVAKLNASDGTIAWQRVIGSVSSDIAYAVTLRNDNTLAIAGTSDSGLAAVDTVFDDFESGSFNSARFDNSTGLTISLNGTGTGTGGGFSASIVGSTRHAEFLNFNNRTLQTDPQDFTSVTEISFDYIYGSGTNGRPLLTSADLTVQISLDGGTWITLATTTAAYSWTTLTVAIPVIYRTANARLRFVQTASGSGFDYIGFDNLTFTAAAGGSGSLIELDTATGDIKTTWKLETAAAIEFYDLVADTQEYYIVGKSDDDYLLLNLDSPIVGGTHSIDSVGIGASDGVYSVTAITDDDTFTMSSTNQINTRTVSVDSLTEVDLSRNAFFHENHYFKTGTAVVYATSGTDLGNLTAGTTYYAISTSKDWFKLAVSYENAVDGTAIPVTDQGTGTHSFTTSAVSGDVIGAGTISIADEGTVVTGTGTLFASQFSPGDIIRLYQPASTATKTISSVNTGTDTITVTAHGMSDGDPIYFTQDAYDLTANWIYYINTSGTGIPANQFTVHATYTDAVAGTNILDLDGATYSAADIIEHIDSIGTATDAVISYVNGQTEVVLRDAVTEAFTDAKYAIGTALLIRADGFALHRPYDGGVELIPSGNPDGQMIRQTRKYFRYQSGKGIQVSMAINFSPTVQTESMTRPSTGTTNRATITTRYPHRLTAGRSVTITGATVTSGTNWWNGTFTVSTVPDQFSFTVLMSGTPSQLAAGGIIDYYVNGWTNSKIKAGLFDDQNGLYFEYDGQDLYAIRRSSVLQISGTSTVAFKSGSVVGLGTKFSTQLSVNDKVVIKGQTYLITNIASDTQMYIMPTYRGTDSDRVIITKVVDTKVVQSSWNVDKCDGTGPSGFFLDIHKIQMAYIDYSWYGAGKARFGFKDQRGKVIYCHEFIHNNRQTEAYMRSGNLPARYEIENIGTPTYVPSLAHWGTSVIMDGRFDDDRAYVFTASSNSLSVTGAATLSITGRIETQTLYQIFASGAYRTVGYGLLIPTSSAVFNNITAGVAVTGANLAANTRTRNPANGFVVPFQPYQASVLSREGNLTATQGTRNILLLDRQPTATAGGTSSYTVTLASGATSVVYEQPLISIRLAPSVDTGTPGALGSREIINRMQLILASVGILTTHSVEITLRLNGTTNNNDWQRVANPSLSQLVYHTTDDRITNGAIIYSFRAQGSTGTSNRAQILTQDDLGEVATLGNSILGGDGVFPDGPDVLTVVAKLVEDPSSVSTANPWIISGRISWSESQA